VERLRLDVGQSLASTGIIVLDVREDSPFIGAGLDRGDVIEEIDRHTVTSAERAATLLRDAAANPSRTVAMLVVRDGSQR
jgi:S1-C subfamily serine protease